MKHLVDELKAKADENIAGNARRRAPRARHARAGRAHAAHADDGGQGQGPAHRRRGPLHRRSLAGGMGTRPRLVAARRGDGGLRRGLSRVRDLAQPRERRRGPLDLRAPRARVRVGRHADRRPDGMALDLRARLVGARAPARRRERAGTSPVRPSGPSGSWAAGPSASSVPGWKNEPHPVSVPKKRSKPRRVTTHRSVCAALTGPTCAARRLRGCQPSLRAILVAQIADLRSDCASHRGTGARPRAGRPAVEPLRAPSRSGPSRRPRHARTLREWRGRCDGVTADFKFTQPRCIAPATLPCASGLLPKRLTSCCRSVALSRALLAHDGETPSCSSGSFVSSAAVLKPCSPSLEVSTRSLRMEATLSAMVEILHRKVGRMPCGPGGHDRASRSRGLCDGAPELRGEARHGSTGDGPAPSERISPRSPAS